MYTTVLHQLFSRVELETYKPDGQRSKVVVWGEYAANDLDVHPDNLMDHVLQEKHSFVFPKADQIRLIRVWDKDGMFISSYNDFMYALGISINSKPALNEPASNPYLVQLQGDSTMYKDPWTRLALLQMWGDLRSVSIGAGANKEMIEVATYGLLLPQFDIELERLIDATAKDITKAAKYIGRLLRPFRYWTMDNPSISVRAWEVDSFIDGWTCSVDLNYCADALKVPNPQIGDRLEITALGVRGLLKGHGVVGEHNEANVIVYGAQFKQIIQSSGLQWFAVDVLHGSNEAYLDIQTLVNLGTTVFPESMLQQWISETISTAISKTKDALLPPILKDLSVLLRDPSKLKADRWCLRRMAMHDLPAMLPVMIRKTYAFHRSSIRKLNNMRVAIPGAVRRYVTPDLLGEVKPGYITIRGQSFYIAREDAEWFHALHGGSDSDDGFVIIPITMNRVLLYRNPNQLGEWSVMQLQDNDHEFEAVNNLQLPISQRLNWKRKDLTVNQIMDTVSSFWEYIASESIEIDRALVPRIPERYRDKVRATDGWVTRMFQYADHHLSLADEAIDLYSKEMNIPEALITAPRSQFYEFARELRGIYGKGIRTARNLNKRFKEKTMAGEAEVDADLRNRIEKVHGRVRGALNQLEPDAQKLVVRDLMRICYLELPGSTAGENGYVLTQANDGVLSISSSPNGRSLGTWDILIDLLVDQGFGRRLNQREDRIEFETSQTPIAYEGTGFAIRVIGGWQCMAGRCTSSMPSEDKLISMAYQEVKLANSVQVNKGHLFIEGTEFGRIVNHDRVADGDYRVLYPGHPGKSQVLYISES